MIKKKKTEFNIQCQYTIYKYVSGYSLKVLKIIDEA